MRNPSDPEKALMAVGRSQATGGMERTWQQQAMGHSRVEGRAVARCRQPQLPAATPPQPAALLVPPSEPPPPHVAALPR